LKKTKLSKTGLSKYILGKCNIHISRKFVRPLKKNNEEVIEERFTWAHSWSETDLNYATNCVFLGEAEFYIDTKRSVPWHKPNKQDIEDNTRVLFCAINTTGVVNFMTKLPIPDKDEYKEDIIEDRYYDLVVNTLEIMDDYYDEFEGSYLVLDNVPLDQRTKTKNYIRSRRYGCVSLPPLSFDLNPVEKFWSTMKRKLKRDQLSKDETISSRVTEAGYEIPTSKLRNFCEYSFHKLID
jgi:transposase